MSEAAAITPEVDEEKISSAKSGVQKRFDQITREKWAFKRQADAASAESAELRTVNLQLRGELAGLRDELQQAKTLLKDYRAELEKYRSKFAEFATKEKHARR